jgi:hypothetical protein
MFRSTLLGLWVCLACVPALPAEAQVRPPSLRQPPPRDGARSTANTRHERIHAQAQEAYQRGEHQRVIELTSGLLREAPRDHRAYYLRAAARVDLGRFRRDGRLVREGFTDARQALRIQGTDTALYYLPYLSGMTALAEIENQSEHARTAVEVAGRVLELPDLSNDEEAKYPVGTQTRRASAGGSALAGARDPRIRARGAVSKARRRNGPTSVDEHQLSQSSYCSNMRKSIRFQSISIS